MNPENMSEEDLQRREEELRVKEQEIRLRELEMEVNKTGQHQQSMQSDPPLYETAKHEEPKRKKSWLRKLPKMLKFGLMIFVTLVLVWTAASIAFQLGRILFAAIIVGGIGFMGYKLYLEGDDD